MVELWMTKVKGPRERPKDGKQGIALRKSNGRKVQHVGNSARASEAREMCAWARELFAREVIAYYECPPYKSQA